MFNNPEALKEQFLKAQEMLSALHVTGSAGGGIVTVTMNGAMDILSVHLDEVAVDPRDISMLQDLIVAASVDAKQKVKEKLEQNVNPLMKGLSGLGSFFQ